MNGQQYQHPVTGEILTVAHAYTDVWGATCALYTGQPLGRECPPTYVDDQGSVHEWTALPTPS